MVIWRLAKSTGQVKSKALQKLSSRVNHISSDLTDTYYMRPKYYDILYKENAPLEKRFKKIPRPAFSLFHRRLIKGLTAKPATGQKNEDARVYLSELSEEELDSLNKYLEGLNSGKKAKQKILPRDVKKGGEIIDKFVFNTRWRFFVEPLKRYDWDNKRKRGRCDFCGTSHLPIKPITGLNHPLMVTTPKYQNFSSNLKKSPKICPYCAISSHFTSAFVPYLLSGNNIFFYAIPQLTGLKEGIEFWNALTINVSGESFGDWSNFEKEPWRYNTAFSAFLALLTYVEKKLQKIRKEAQEDIEKKKEFPDFFIEMTNEQLWKLKCKSWTVVYGDSLVPKVVTHYHSTPRLYKLMRDLRDNGLELKFFVSSFSYRPQGSKDYITRYRDEIAKKVLNFQSVNQTIESFLNEVASSGSDKTIWGLHHFLKIYNKEVMKMNEKDVNRAIYIGGKIGEYCRENRDMGLLYELRSCTNRTQFLEFLDRATFLVPDLSVGKKFILKLTDEEWEDHKSLVGIYAHQSYHQSQSSTENKQKGGGENE